MTEIERLIELIMNTPKIPFTVFGRAQGKTYQTAKNIADHLLANGVMCIDTNTVDVVKNREPLITAFGMPLNELADLIRAKREGRVIVPPCKVGDTVYLIYRGEVTQGTVRLIRPFVSEQETIFKGNIICEVDNLFIDDGTKEEHELYVVFEKPYGIERVAYLTREEVEKALAERSNDGKS